jgi:two-component system sensor histidine kinase UhpB
MENRLRALIVEDSDDDAELLLRQLRKASYSLEYEITDNEAQFKSALDKQEWDIIISDYVLPNISGLEILKILRERKSEIPCLIVSGKIDDETAVTAMKSGAKDYIMKTNLNRLGPAIERELSEADIRRENKQADAELKLRATILDMATDVILLRDMDHWFVYVNEAACRMYKYSKEEFKDKNLRDIIAPHEIPFFDEQISKIKKNGFLKSEVWHMRKDRSLIPVESISHVITIDAKSYILTITRDITEQKRIREEKDQFTRKIVEAQEAERNRISRELHDDTAQWLALLTLEMDDLITRCNQLPPDTLSRLQKLRQTTEKALQEVRRFSHELRPSVLEHFGLGAALELIVSEFSSFDSTPRVEAEFNMSGSNERLGEEIELVLFRIAQESLNNIRKHARATYVTVSLKTNEKSINLLISDNGRGFELKKKPVSSITRGLGLVGMRERANLIGGKLIVKSIPGKGTTILVKVPRKA